MQDLLLAIYSPPLTQRWLKVDDDEEVDEAYEVDKVSRRGQLRRPG